MNHPPDILLVAPPEGRRARAFRASMEGLGWPAPRVASYLDLLSGRQQLADLVRPGTVVRFDSPGEDIATEQEIIRLGGGQAGDLAGGEIAPMREWFAGFSQVLRWLDAELRAAPPHLRMQCPESILTMFDKPATHQRLQAAGVGVPDALPEVNSFDELMLSARERGWTRVFVKLAYGSSASGAVALQWSGERVSAVTTVHMQDGRLFNSRQLRQYRTWHEVQTLIDALAPHRLHVEQWLPKASLQGHTMDLRVVVIARKARHALVRLGHGPITNLHLGNERGDLKVLLHEIGPERWREVQRTCEAALNAFPDALYGGVDVMLTPGWRRHAILEVNAFGDYHRGVLVDGMDTYAAELMAVRGAWEKRSVGRGL